MKKEFVNFILLIGIPAVVYAYHYFNPSFFNKYKKSTSLTMIGYFILIVFATSFITGCTSETEKKPIESKKPILDIKYEKPDWDNGAVQSLDSPGKTDNKGKK